MSTNEPSSDPETTIRSELLRISEEILDAICAHDAQRLASHLTHDFVLLSGASRQDREAFLAGVRGAEFKTRQSGFEAIEVELMDTSAIVAGIQRVEVEQGGEILESRAGFTDLFVRQDDRWLLRVAVSVELGD